MDKKQIAELIRKSRRAADLTQSQLATMANTKHSRIAEIETGNVNFTIDTIIPILKALNLSIAIIPQDQATRL